MTIKEIAASVGKDESTVRRWISKLTGKMPAINDKVSASSPMYPADYDLEETIEIIRVGLGANAAEMFRFNAEHGNTALPQTAEVGQVMIQMMKMMSVLVEKVEKISSNQLQIEAPKQDYYSLVGYCSLKGIKTKVSELSGIGMILRKMTIEAGRELKKIPDERWGKVNSYPVEILDEFFTP